MTTCFILPQPVHGKALCKHEMLQVFPYPDHTYISLILDVLGWKSFPADVLRILHDASSWPLTSHQLWQASLTF